MTYGLVVLLIVLIVIVGSILTQWCTMFQETISENVWIFVDDYLNVLSIGACIKDVYDKRKIPRETLAFMLDSTGAPVCVLLPFSTWAVFYASLFIDQPSVQAYGFTSGMKAYLSAIPFCFYPTFTLLVLAFLLQKVTEQLNMTDYIIDLAQPCYRSLAS